MLLNICHSTKFYFINSSNLFFLAYCNMQPLIMYLIILLMKNLRIFRFHPNGKVFLLINLHNFQNHRMYAGCLFVKYFWTDLNFRSLYKSLLKSNIFEPHFYRSVFIIQLLAHLKINSLQILKMLCIIF